MDENIFQEGLEFNQIHGLNQNNPLDNQLIQNESFIRNAKILIFHFIAPIIILPILEFFIVIITVIYLYDSKDETEYEEVGFTYIIVFPISNFISIIIILTNLCCLNCPEIKIGIFIIFFLLKFIAVIFFIVLLSRYIFSVIFIIIVLISFLVCSFTLQIKLEKLKKQFR